MRSSDALAMTGAASFRISLRTGLPCCAASAMPTKPPIEVPSQLTASTSRRAISVTMSATYCGPGVELRVGEPVGVAAPGDVGADDAELRAQRARQLVEIARRAREAVHADQDVPVARVAPLAVGHAVQARGRGALHRAAARFYLLSHCATMAARAARASSSSVE